MQNERIAAVNKRVFASWISICCMFVCVSASHAVDDGGVSGDGIARAILEDIVESGSDSNTPPPARNPPPPAAGLPNLGDSGGSPAPVAGLFSDFEAPSPNPGSNPGQGSGENTNGRDDLNPSDGETTDLPDNSLGNELARDYHSGALVGYPGIEVRRDGRPPETRRVPRDIGFNPASQIRTMPNTPQYQTDPGTLPSALANNPEWMRLNNLSNEGNWRRAELDRIRGEIENRLDLNNDERAAMLGRIRREREREDARQDENTRRANEINDARRRNNPDSDGPEPYDFDTEFSSESRDRETSNIGREAAGQEANRGDISEPEPEAPHPPPDHPSGFREPE